MPEVGGVPQVPFGQIPPIPSSPTVAGAFGAAIDPLARVIQLAVSAARADGQPTDQEKSMIMDRAREAGIPALLTYATQDFWHDVEARFPDDLPAMTRQALALSASRVEDYVAALAGDGPLRPK